MSKLFTITDGLENMGAVKTGGQGSVYKGRRAGEIITAIKLLPTPIFSQSQDDEHYRDFINEVTKLQRVAEAPCPHVVKMLSYGVNETSGFPFIEMEYIDGPDLTELLTVPYDPVFTIKDIIKVAEELSSALAHCHSLGVRHGDVKSNNVRYNNQKGGYVLLDFGLAAMSDEQRRTSLQHAGAVEFMAPEQNEGKLFFQTDVYSFGVVLFELLTGRVPFPLGDKSLTARNKVMVAHMENSPPDLLSLRAHMLPPDWSPQKKAAEMNVPQWLITTIYKCLRKAPEARFADGAALHNFILRHKIDTGADHSLVAQEASKWQSVIKEKDDELENLKAVVSRQEKELRRLGQNVSPSGAMHKGRKISQSLFNVILVALALIMICSIYGFFFRPAGLNPVAKLRDAETAKDALPDRAAKNTTFVSVNANNVKEQARVEQKYTMPSPTKPAERTTVKKREGVFAVSGTQ